MFHVTKRYTEQKNIVTMRKLDACNFISLLSKDCKPPDSIDACKYTRSSQR